MSKFSLSQLHSESLLNIDDDDEEDDVDKRDGTVKEKSNPESMAFQLDDGHALEILSHHIDLEILYKHQEKMLLLKCIKCTEDLLDILSRLMYLGMLGAFL